MLRGNPPSPRARGALKKNLRPPEPKGSGGGNPPSPRARGAFKKKFVAPGGY
jgi:hypothetical protein